MKTPTFWSSRTSLLSVMLLPLSWLYYCFSRLYFVLRPQYKGSVPIICVGNLTMGGAGKTTVAIFLAQRFQNQGKRVHFVSRGYKGSLKGPVQVSSDHTFSEVGDEPLLLSRIAPTWIAKNRLEGAQAAIQAGADLVIFDDGHQNPTVKKDVSLLVIDSVYGLGNYRLFPAGPLREFSKAGISRAQGIILMGRGNFQIPCHLPIIRIDFSPNLEDLHVLQGKKIILFAGIGHPEKFFRMMKEYENTYKYEIVECLSFADHYLYQTSDIDQLYGKAKNKGAILVTTEKDFVKINKSHNIYCIRLVLELLEGNWTDVDQKIF